VPSMFASFAAAKSRDDITQQRPDSNARHSNGAFKNICAFKSSSKGVITTTSAAMSLRTPRIHPTYSMETHTSSTGRETGC
jgi:hypothetical protein